jgi:hypothetical protein
MSLIAISAYWSYQPLFQDLHMGGAGRGRDVRDHQKEKNNLTNDEVGICNMFTPNTPKKLRAAQAAASKASLKRYNKMVVRFFIFHGLVLCE